MEHVVEGRLMAKNANFYAFTATPKNKTLQMFGDEYIKPDGEKGHRPFHLYSMKQAIEEGFILDVTKNYTTYDSFYKILKNTETNPMFDKDQAAKKLRAWVESRPETVEKKARIMVEHFHESVCHKIGGEARCMVATAGRAQQPLQGNHCLLGHEGIWRQELRRGTTQPVSLIEDRKDIQHRRLSLPDRCRQVSDRLRQQAAPHHVCG